MWQTEHRCIHGEGRIVQRGELYFSSHVTSSSATRNQCIHQIFLDRFFAIAIGKNPNEAKTLSGLARRSLET